MNNSENKTDSFLTQEAKDVIQELLEINSGGGGGTSDYDDLTNKPSINGVSLSGDMSADDLGLAETSDIPDISGLYTKPNGGIPKSDLSSDVKTSLGKADTALQSFTETDPTVPSWAKAVNKPTYTASEVGALPVGTPIPSVDNTLTTQGAAADAKAVGDAISGATNAINNINSEISEMVKSVNSVSPDANGNVDVAVDQTLVDNWLDEHPEATTTVQDGSITYSKLNSEVSGDISGLKNALNDKAPAIYDITDESPNHVGLGTIPHSVAVKTFDTNLYGNIIVANGINCFDVSEKSAMTVRGVTITPSANNSFNLDGTATGVTLATFELNCANDAERCPVSGETLIVKVFTTQSIRLLIGGLTGTTQRELKDVTISTTNSLVNIAITKTITEGTDGYYVKFCSTSGTVFDNVRVWIGIYHEGTTFTDFDTAPPQTIDSSLPKLSTLFYPSVVTYVADTKTYIDKLDIDINEKLTYVTPEKFYGGDIPQNVDAQPYIAQAIEYAMANSIPVVCGKSYTTTTPLEIVALSTNIYINKLTYTSSTGYAIVFRGRANKLSITWLVSSGGGIDFHATGNTTDTSVRSNIIQIGRIQSTGHCLMFDGEEGVVNGSNSYNYIQCNALSSTNGNAIRSEIDSGFCENVFFGGETRTYNDYGLYLRASVNNCFYNFCLESYTYQGIFLSASGNRFINFRTIECQDSCDNNGRIFMKITGSSTSNIFNGTAPHSYGIDVSELVIPPENAGSQVSGWTYGLTVSKYVIATDFRNTSRRASYYGSTARYYNDVGNWAINLEGKIIHKLAKPSIFTVNASAVDMSVETECNYFVIDSLNSTITLSPSYCADGIPEIYIEQKNGYKATVYNDENTLVFDGTSLADGVYKIEFIAQQLPYTPSTKTYYTWFFGKGSVPKVSRVDAV